MNLTPLQCLDKLWEAATNPYEYLLDDSPKNIKYKIIIQNALEELEVLKRLQNG